MGRLKQTQIQSLSLHFLGEIFTCLLLVHEPFLALRTSVGCIFLKKAWLQPLEQYSQSGHSSLQVTGQKYRQRPSGGSSHGELNTELTVRAGGQVALKLGIRKQELGSSTKVREKKYFRWKQRLELKGWSIMTFWVAVDILFGRCDTHGLPTAALNLIFLLVVQLLAQSEIQNDSRCLSAPYPHLTNDLDFIQGTWNVTIVLKVNMKFLTFKVFLSKRKKELGPLFFFKGRESLFWKQL